MSDTDVDKRSPVRELVDLSAVLGMVRWPNGDTQPTVEGERPFVVVPDSYEAISLDRFFDRPRLTTANVVCSTVDSFIAYVKAWKGHAQGDPLAFADEAAGKVACVLDYDAPEKPSHRTHKCSLALELTPEWQTWMGQNGKPFGQMEFARFLENNLLDVVTPDGATLLEMAASLEVKKGVQFLSAVRLQDGLRQFSYQETGETAAKGALKLPEVFVLGLAPWKGCEPYRMEARLRYRISDEKGLSLWYDLVRPHLILRDAFRSILETVREKSGVTVLEGKLA